VAPLCPTAKLKRKMNDDTKEKKFMAAVGFGSHSGRHEGSVDLATLGSSSHQGPTASLPAGLAENVASAATLSRMKSADSAQEVRSGLQQLNWCDLPGSSAAHENQEDDMDTEKYDSDEDTRSVVFYISVSSARSQRATARKRKQESLEEDTNIVNRKRIQEGDSEAEREFKPPSSRSSSTERVIGRIPTVTKKTEEELNGMSIEDLRNLALTWLDHIDKSRSASKNIQGLIVKIMKDRTNSIRDIINCLAEKALVKDDPIRHKLQNAELTIKIKCLEREENKWKAEKNRLKQEITVGKEK